MELLVGAGAKREKHLCRPGHKEWDGLVTLDMNEAHAPDYVWDLNNRPLPFADDTFDEIHAYEVLEHLGQQGDWRGYFAEWSEWWRILKPGGQIFATSPMWNSMWACTAMTDYRFVYKADFNMTFLEQQGECFSYGMQAIKPSRISI